jgi:hypothetical protein
MQRTLGEMDTTARLPDFTPSLTTSRNPGVTGSLDVLAADHPERIPVLDMVSDAAMAPTPKPTTEAPVRRQRTWSPSPATIQRALQAQPTTVQRADVEPPAREIYPVKPEFQVESRSGSLTDAPQPPEDRSLIVTSDPAWNEPPATPSVEQHAEPTSTILPTMSTSGVPDVAEPEPSSHHPVPTVPSVDALPSIGALSPIGAVPSVSAAGVAATPVSHLRTVQRAANGSTTPQQRTTTAKPAVSPLDPPPHRADTHQPATTQSLDSGLPKSHIDIPEHGPTDRIDAPLQRATGPATDAGETDLVTSVHRIGQVSDRMLPTASTHDIRTLAPATTLGAQRSTDTPSPPPRTSPSNDPQRTTTPTASASVPSSSPLRHPSIGEQPGLPEVSSSPRRYELPVLPPVQRSTAPGPPRLSPAPADGRIPQTPGATPLAAPPAATAAVQTSAPPRDPEVSMKSSGTQPNTDMPRMPVAQRSAAPIGRLVILPPVRSTPAVPSEKPQSITDSVIFESQPRMSLQRMFEQSTAVHTDGAADSSPNRPDPAPRSRSVEADTPTVTLPNIQREPDPGPEQAAPPEQPPAPSPVPSAASATPNAGASPPVDIEEMINRMYDPLAARLRGELWLDRERAGALMDLTR